MSSWSCGLDPLASVLSVERLDRLLVPPTSCLFSSPPISWHCETERHAQSLPAGRELAIHAPSSAGLSQT